MGRLKLFFAFAAGFILAAIFFSLVILYIDKKTKNTQEKENINYDNTQEELTEGIKEDEKYDNDSSANIITTKESSIEKREEYTDNKGVENEDIIDNNSQNEDEYLNEDEIKEYLKELDEEIAEEYGDFNFSGATIIDFMSKFNGSETKEDIENIFPGEHKWSATTSDVFTEHLRYERIVDDCGDVSLNFTSESYKESEGAKISYIQYSLTKSYCSKNNFEYMYKDICNVLGEPDNDVEKNGRRVVSWGKYELSTYDYNTWIYFTRRF